MPPIISQSNDPVNDALLGPDLLCGHAPASAYQDRCGYGARLPIPVNKSSLTTIDIFQLKILVKC